MHKDLPSIAALTRGSLFLFVLVAMLCGGCASETSKPSEVPTGAPEVRATHLTDADQKLYTDALQVLNQEPERAAGVLAKLAQRHPANAAVKTNLALAYYLSGDFERAVMVSEEATSLNDRIAENYNLRGLIAMEQSEFGVAETSFLAALERHPRLALGHYNLALLYDLYFQRIAEALKHYEEYLTFYPEDADTATWVAQLKRSLDNE